MDFSSLLLSLVVIGMIVVSIMCVARVFANAIAMENLNAEEEWDKQDQQALSFETREIRS